MSVSRRSFIASAWAGFLFPTSALPQGRGDMGYSPFSPDNFSLKIINGFEPNLNGRPLSREIMICLDRSGSIDPVEEQASIEAVLLSIKDSKLLSSNPNDRFCAGPVGIGLVAFNHNPNQVGYMVIHSPEDVDNALETLRLITPRHRFSSTNPAEGLHMSRHMFRLSPCRAPFPHQRMVFLIGDQGQTIQGDPVNRSIELAVYEGATTHCIEMGANGHYAGISTPAGIMFQNNQSGYVDEVRPGQIVGARNVEDISRFMIEQIDPNCHLSFKMQPGTALTAPVYRT